MSCKLDAVQKNRIVSAIWEFGGAIKESHYDPNWNDATQGVNLPGRAVDTVLAKITAAVEETAVVYNQRDIINSLLKEHGYDFEVQDVHIRQ